MQPSPRMSAYLLSCAPLTWNNCRLSKWRDLSVPVQAGSPGMDWYGVLTEPTSVTRPWRRRGVLYHICHVIWQYFNMWDSFKSWFCRYMIDGMSYTFTLYSVLHYGFCIHTEGRTEKTLHTSWKETKCSPTLLLLFYGKSPFVQVLIT